MGSQDQKNKDTNVADATKDALANGASDSGNAGAATAYANSDGETPTKETPAKETPAKETPAKETPAKEAPKKTEKNDDADNAVSEGLMPTKKEIAQAKVIADANQASEVYQNNKGEFFLDKALALMSVNKPEKVFTHEF